MNSRTPTEQRFLNLVTEHQLRLRRMCRSFSSDQEGQEALYQEILFQIWRALPQLKEAQAPPAWLYRVALNTASSLARKTGSRSPGFALPPVPAPGSSDPAARLSAALSQLSAVERALATLYLENLSPDEMVPILGVSLGQVGQMLQRLKPQLFACLPAPHPDEETLKRYWQPSPTQPAPKPLPEDQQLQRVQARLQQFDRSSRPRNRVEIIAALVLMICFGTYFFLFRRFPLARLGSVVVILSAGLIGWKLLRAKGTLPEPGPSSPLVEFLQQELARISAQVRRLQTILYWNIAPLMLGLNLFCFGLPRRGAYKIYFLVITLGLSLGGYWLNQRVLRRKALPLKAELEKVHGVSLA